MIMTSQLKTLTCICVVLGDFEALLSPAHEVLSLDSCLGDRVVLGKSGGLSCVPVPFIVAKRLFKREAGLVRISDNRLARVAT